MKDIITILVCNAIREAERQSKATNRPLTDAEVGAIALKTQYNYHVSEAQRMMNQGQMGAQQPRPKVQLKAVVTPPEDMDVAARNTLGDRYEAFISEFGADFTPKQLCEFHERT